MIIGESGVWPCNSLFIRDLDHCSLCKIIGCLYFQSCEFSFKYWLWVSLFKINCSFCAWFFFPVKHGDPSPSGDWTNTHFPLLFCGSVLYFIYPVSSPISRVVYAHCVKSGRWGKWWGWREEHLPEYSIVMFLHFSLLFFLPTYICTIRTLVSLHRWSLSHPVLCHASVI